MLSRVGDKVSSVPRQEEWRGRLGQELGQTLEVLAGQRGNLFFFIHLGTISRVIPYSLTLHTHSIISN